MRAAAMARMAALAGLAGWLVCADAGAEPGRFDGQSGRQLYERFCASCHGSAGFGDGPVAASLKVVVPDLTRLYRANGGSFPEERVRRAIDGRTVHQAHGSRYMPVWGEVLSAEEGGDEAAQAAAARVVDKLVNYLHSIQQ
ncbi:MAG: cytochrome c [Gammaproteobacteria bacterium]